MLNKTRDRTGQPAWADGNLLPSAAADHDRRTP
jgi:hypothetical protein